MGRLCYVGEPPAASHDRFIDEDGDQWSSSLCLSSVTASWVEQRKRLSKAQRLQGDVFR